MTTTHESAQDAQQEYVQAHQEMDAAEMSKQRLSALQAELSQIDQRLAAMK